MSEPPIERMQVTFHFHIYDAPQPGLYTLMLWTEPHIMDAQTFDSFPSKEQAREYANHLLDRIKSFPGSEVLSQSLWID